MNTSLKTPDRPADQPRAAAASSASAPPQASEPAAGIDVLRDRASLRGALATERRAGRTIGLVPTMGALHAGHSALIEAAAAECDTVLVSIFVNPAQFGQGEDYDTYPRDEAADLDLAARAGARLAYLPEAAEVYPPGFATRVEVDGLTGVMCGAPESRGAAHFHGVTTVVCKLLCATAPDRAYFGRKDAQQLAIIRRMVADLEIPVNIRGVETVREPDGLAMSSRNVYLSAADRERASAIPRALEAGRAAAASGVAGPETDTGGTDKATSGGRPVAAARRVLEAAGIEAEYVELRDPDDLTPVQEPLERPALLALAATVGQARLIDNVTIDPAAEATGKIPASTHEKAEADEEAEADER